MHFCTFWCKWFLVNSRFICLQRLLMWHCRVRIHGLPQKVKILRRCGKMKSQLHLEVKYSPWSRLLGINERMTWKIITRWPVSSRGTWWTPSLNVLSTEPGFAEYPTKLKQLMDSQNPAELNQLISATKSQTNYSGVLRGGPVNLDRLNSLGIFKNTNFYIRLSVEQLILLRCEIKPEIGSKRGKN